MSRVRTSRFAPVAAAAIVAATLAAMPGTARGQQEGPREIEQDVADGGALSTSLRGFSNDLRQPAGFDRLFRLPGPDGQLMRADGGLYAVFPRSRYIRVTSKKMDKVFPIIPDGTVFYIGPPSFLTIGSSADSRSDAMTAAAGNANGAARGLPGARPGVGEDRNRGVGVHGGPPPPIYAPRLHPTPGSPDEAAAIAAQSRRTAQSPKPVTIITDEAYREARLRELMQQAAAAARSK